MKDKLKELENSVSLADAERLSDELASFGENHSLTDEEQQRILSSVMRKAGFEMNETIRINRTQRNSRMDTHKDHTAEVVRRKHGSAIAACLVVVAAGAIGASLLFGQGVDIAKPKDPMSSSVTDPADSGKRAVQDWAKPYLEENPDTVGYLSLGMYADSLGTYEEISFPVVQRDNNEYYETTGFNGQPDENGAVHADCNAKIDENGQPQNIILWGTEISWKDIEREISLAYAQYETKYIEGSDYYFNSGIIRFKTIYDADYSEYQIVSDFSMDLQKDSEEQKIDFAFYNNELRYSNFDEEHSFDSWRKMQSDYNENRYYIFNEDIPCTENDEYLTLSVGYRDDPDEGSDPAWRQNIIAKKLTPETGTKREVRDWAKPYLEQNPETVGYLKIKGLRDSGDLESPVVQHEDNEYYFSHGFDNEPCESGVIFADCTVPINENGQPSNIILYGQNMRVNSDNADDVMFSSLLKYKDSTFFDTHQIIDFCTVYDDPDTRYQIIACFSIDLDYEKYERGTDFEYWRYRNFDDEFDFDTWSARLKEYSIYETDTDFTEKDEYITLSTAYGNNSRFAVVAKKITDTDMLNIWLPVPTP